MYNYNRKFLREVMNSNLGSNKISLLERMDKFSENFRDKRIIVASDEQFIPHDAVLQGLIRGGLTIKSMFSERDTGHIREDERFGLGLCIRQNDEGGFHGVCGMKPGHSRDYRYNFEENDKGFQFQKIKASHLLELASWADSMSALNFDEIRENQKISENQVPAIVHRLMPCFSKSIEAELFAHNERPDLFEQLGYASLVDVPAHGMRAEKPLIHENSKVEILKM